MKRIVLAATLAATMAVCADDPDRGQQVDLVFTTPAERVSPFTKDVVTGGEDGALYDRAGKLWPRIEKIAIENGITNMLWAVDTYTNALKDAVADLASRTNSLPREGLVLGLRFPLDNTSDRRAIEGYVVDYGVDAGKGYDWLDVHFTKYVVEPTLTMDYVYEGGPTNTVTGAWKLSAYQGSHWTNATSRTWRNYTYDNIHRCYFRRPAEAAGMPLHVNPHLKWNLSAWGSTIVTVNGKEALDGTVLNTQTGAYRTYSQGLRMEPAYQYVALSAAKKAEYADKLRVAAASGAKLEAKARAKARKTLGIEKYR